MPRIVVGSKCADLERMVAQKRRQLQREECQLRRELKKGAYRGSTTANVYSMLTMRVNARSCQTGGRFQKRVKSHVGKCEGRITVTKRFSNSRLTCVCKSVRAY